MSFLDRLKMAGFSKKRMKVKTFLEGPFLEAVVDEGVLRHENFYDFFYERLATVIEQGGYQTGTHEITLTRIDRDHFTNCFTGALLWLLKYRLLSTNDNLPRKLAFLDLLFDNEIPRLIDKHFARLDTGTIKDTYDNMDTQCKKGFTQEQKESAPPTFIASPIWAKNPQPDPFRLATEVFAELIGYGMLFEETRTDAVEKFTDEMAQRFMEMTVSVEKASTGISFLWKTPREKP